MSQEILFLIFLALEALMLVAIYQLVLLKMIRQAVVRHWIEEIESGRIDLPSVLESYTASLLANIDALLFGYPDPDNLDKHGNPKHKKGKIQIYFPELLGGYMSGGIKQLKTDPENMVAVATSEYLEELPLPAQLVARSLLPKLQEALSKTSPKVKEASATYRPGLDKP